MKKIIFVLLLFFAMTTVQSQEKGFYLTLDGGLGWTNFGCKLKDGSARGSLGYGGSLGFQYFFTRHWGFALRGEYFVFNTQSRYTDKRFTFKSQIDNEGHVHDLSIRFRNWKENQTTAFVEVPLLLMYQHKFGKTERHGLYFGIGAKAQIPIKSTYERGDGKVSISAYHPEWGLSLGEEDLSVELPQHGYGTNKNRLWSGDNDLKMSFAVAGEFGALFGLSRRVDLTLGVSADYGLTDIKKKQDDLTGPVSGTTQQAGSFVAENVFYNGVLNSNQTEKINTMSVRGKIGLRIKLGKLKERIEKEREEKEEVRIPLRDTIVINTVAAPYPSSLDSLLGVLIETTAQRNKDVKSTPEKDMFAEAEDILLNRVYFDLNKSNLRPDAIEVLDRKVEIMKKYPNTILYAIGHTCDLSGDMYNQKLSLDRAESVRAYLAKKGIAPSRIKTIPRGKQDPAVPNTSEKNRELNRMVMFVISNMY